MTDGIRTRDLQGHNLALFLLSYGHHVPAAGGGCESLRGWQGWQDLNPRHTVLETVALARLSYTPASPTQLLVASPSSGVRRRDGGHRAGKGDTIRTCNLRVWKPLLFR